MTGRPREISDETIAKMREMREEGHAPKDIAVALGVSRATAYAYTKADHGGGERKFRHLTDKEIAEIREMRSAGYTLQSIAEAYSIHTTSVQRHVGDVLQRNARGAHAGRHTPRAKPMFDYPEVKEYVEQTRRECNGAQISVEEFVMRCFRHSRETIRQQYVDELGQAAILRSTLKAELERRMREIESLDADGLRKMVDQMSPKEMVRTIPYVAIPKELMKPEPEPEPEPEAKPEPAPMQDDISEPEITPKVVDARDNVTEPPMQVPVKPKRQKPAPAKPIAPIMQFWYCPSKEGVTTPAKDHTRSVTPSDPEGWSQKRWKEKAVPAGKLTVLITDELPPDGTMILKKHDAIHFFGHCHITNMVRAASVRHDQTC